MSKPPPWPREDLDYLCDVWPDSTIPTSEISAKLGKTPRQVRNRAYLLGIKRDHKWTPEEDAILIRMWKPGGACAPEVAIAVGRPLLGVRSRARRLGLKWHDQQDNN